MNYFSKVVDSAKSAIQKATGSEGSATSSSTKSIADIAKQIPAVASITSTLRTNSATPTPAIPREPATPATRGSGSAQEGPLRNMVQATKDLIERTIPEPYLYKDFGRDALPIPAEGYRFPSPGSQPDPHFLRGKEARLAKNYLFQRGYYMARDAGVELRKQTGDELWRNINTWGPLNINPAEYHFQITRQSDDKDQTVRVK